MKKDPLLHVLEYFAYFSYPPSLEEIHLFIGEKISRKELQKKLEKHPQIKSFGALDKSSTRYTFGTKVNFFELFNEREATSSRKMEKVAGYLKILNRLPFLLLTGISGSVAMKNAKMTDDIDIFIITIKNRLWTARFCAVILAQILGIKRNREDKVVTDKVCLNLFFDGKNVKIPAHKQNEYVAHEVLQLKPILNRKNTYERFLTENSWVKNYFPNAVLPQKKIISAKDSSWTGDLIERIMRFVQLKIMKPHQTKELISDSQLWFYPRDFEKVLKKHIPIQDIG
jgi:hypothetical protein